VFPMSQFLNTQLHIFPSHPVPPVPVTRIPLPVSTYILLFLVAPLLVSTFTTFLCLLFLFLSNPLILSFSQSVAIASVSH
jgi:hypothetical protein